MTDTDTSMGFPVERSGNDSSTDDPDILEDRFYKEMEDYEPPCDDCCAIEANFYDTRTGKQLCKDCAPLCDGCENIAICTRLVTFPIPYRGGNTNVQPGFLPLCDKCAIKYVCKFIYDSNNDAYCEHCYSEVEGPVNDHKCVFEPEIKEPENN